MSRSRSGGMLLLWPCGWQGGESLRAERGLLLGRRSEQVDKSRAASNLGPTASEIYPGLVNTAALGRTNPHRGCNQIPTSGLLVIRSEWAAKIE
jgi:hypothetical protein